MEINLRHIKTVVLPTGLSLLLLASTPSMAKFKCWKNSEGVRECGTSVPPEYAQQGHQTVNKHGVARETSKAKSLEEVAAERAAKAEAAEAAIEQEKRNKLDRVLLATFASEDDLVLTRDGQIAHLESQIRLTQSHLDKLQTNLDKMVDRAADAERRGEKPSDKMVGNIANVRAQITENEEFISTKRGEQTDIRARFDADIKRFRELKGGG